MGDYNRQSPTLLGSEWRPQTSRNIVLSALNRGVAQRFVPGNVTAASWDAYLSTITGSPGLAIEIVSTLTPTLDTPVDRFPGTNTGATKSDWVDEASGTSDYTDVDQKTFDGTHYLQPNTAAESDLMFRAASSITSGKRVVSITQNLLARWPGVAAGGVNGFFYSSGGGTAYPGIKGQVNLGGVNYPTGLVVAAPSSQFATYSSPAMWLNPSTNKPWTLTDANTLCNGTDEFGINRASSIYTSEVNVTGLWLTVQTCAENRVACYYTRTGQTLGWQKYALIHPDTGGTISAFSANTYYWLVMYLLNTEGGASLTLPALKDTNLILTTAASGSTGDHRQSYNVVLSSGVVTDSEANPGEHIPGMLVTSAPAVSNESTPYIALTPLEVSTGPSQQVTATSGTTYGGVRLNVGWESTNLRSGTAAPDAPLLIEIRKGAGAETGTGTLSATATVNPDKLLSGGFQDIQVPFDAAFVSTSSQYYVFFRSAASTDRSWVVGQLDTRSDNVTTVTAAEVQGQSVGGTTDSYVDTSGTADDRYDIPVLLIPSVSAPASPTATVLAAS